MTFLINLRRILITGLSAFGLYALLSTPEDNSTLWWSELISSKIIALFCIVLVCLIYKRLGVNLNDDCTSK